MALGNRDLHAVLHALFALSRANRRIDAHCVGEAAGVDVDAAADALRQLEMAGLVDATRMRLTMSGLAVAVSTSAHVVRGRQPPRCGVA